MEEPSGNLSTKLATTLLQGLLCSLFIVIEDEDLKLNPIVIYLNEDGSTGFERCQEENYEGRRFAVSGFLEDSFVICGGYGKGKTMSDCRVIDEFGSHTFKMLGIGRDHASAVKLNDTTLWITGGSNAKAIQLDTTEFVTTTGTIEGINLPIGVSDHCMLQIKPELILIIGGYQERTSFSDKTWIIDPTNGFNMTEGPSLKQRRKLHSCGTLKDEYGNVLVVVAGNNSQNAITLDVEFLNTTLLKKWEEGKCI